MWTKNIDGIEMQYCYCYCDTFLTKYRHIGTAIYFSSIAKNANNHAIWYTGS